MGMIKEFKEFALKGNMVDMAVGIIIGGAFGIIIKSLISDVIMPIVGIAGKADFSNLYVPLTSGAREAIEAKAAEQGVEVLALADAQTLGPVLAYGNFVTVLINFLILAFAVFMMVKAMNTARKKMEKKVEEAPAEPPVAPAEVLLLTEIRDLLAKG
ncbi:MAG: large conductance mechanosensitive channel protein MscL [Phycisphaerales bacterium JB040]